MDIKTKKLRIAKIEVEKLFGVYDYTLDCFSNKTEDNLIILYGDNGCLLYTSTSPRDS